MLTNVTKKWIVKLWFNPRQRNTTWTRYIFYFENKTLTWQEISISMKPPNDIAKEYFVRKENHQVQNTTDSIKKNLDAESKKIT